MIVYVDEQTWEGPYTVLTGDRLAAYRRGSRKEDVELSDVLAGISEKADEAGNKLPEMDDFKSLLTYAAAHNLSLDLQVVVGT